VREIVFDAISSALAELSIPERPHDFGIRSSGTGIESIHEVGVYGSPRWRLRLALDDSWEVETLPSGRLLSARRPMPEDLEWTYLTWAEGSRAESGASVLYALPPGRYLLVRSRIEPRRTPTVMLGNEIVSNPPANMRGLLDKRPFYAMVLGPESANPPVTMHPLVGIVGLNYNGSSRMNGALFFDCVASEGHKTREERGAAPLGDLVLVIPVAGELVIALWVGTYALISGILLTALGLRLRNWTKALTSGRLFAEPIR